MYTTAFLLGFACGFVAAAVFAWATRREDHGPH